MIDVKNLTVLLDQIAEEKGLKKERVMEAIEQAIDKEFNVAESDYLRLIAVYLRQNDYKKIIWAQEKLVALKPNNAQYHASLAAAYVKVGRIDDAVKEAREAARLDKMFEAEARSFIRSLGREF